MSFLEQGYNGSLAGLTEVVLVPAPVLYQRNLVKSVKICNIDTAPVLVKVYLKDGAQKYYICQITLAVGDTLVLEEADCEVLDTTAKSLCVVMGAIAATVSPTFTAAFAMVQ